MPECPFLNTCKWLKKYSATGGVKVNHFIKNYCKGDYLRKCARKKVAEKLGGREFVPDNMQPDGNPMKGTDDRDWSDEVKEIIRTEHGTQHAKY